MVRFQYYHSRSTIDKGLFLIILIINNVRLNNYCEFILDFNLIIECVTNNCTIYDLGMTFGLRIFNL